MMMIVLLLAICVATTTAYKNYGDYRLFTVHGADKALTEVLEEKFDVWERGGGGVLQVFGPQTLLRETLSSSSSLVSFEEEKMDVQALIDAEQQRLAAYAAKDASTKRNEWHTEYHPYEDIIGYYQQRCIESSSICSFIPSVGNLTWNGLPIPAAVLSIGNAAAKPKLYWEFNIHAREWITSAAGQYLFDQILLLHDAGDAQVVSILQSAAIVFVPVVNPDGLVHTWTVDRMWRKNRRNNGGSYGVDLNRNWDAQWGGGGSSGTPSSDTYRGPSVASEPETQALVSFFNSLGNVVGSIDFHSYSQYILRPYTHTNAASPHEAQHALVGDNMRDIIFAVHGRRYTSGRWFSTLYESSGVAQDWWYAQGSYAFTLELRPTTAVPGFELPPSEIIPQGEELLPAVLYFAEACVENPILSSVAAAK